MSEISPLASQCLPHGPSQFSLLALQKASPRCVHVPRSRLQHPLPGVGGVLKRERESTSKRQMEIRSSVSINLRSRLRVCGRVCCRGVVSVCRRNGWRTIGWRTWRPIGASVKTLRGAGSINLATCQVFAATVGRAGTISEPGKALGSTDNRRLGSRRLRRRFGRDVRGWRATLKDRYFSAVLSRTKRAVRGRDGKRCL